MVCWLKFLKFVSDSLKDIEPNLGKRKRLSIDLLKDIEKEIGHDVDKIGGLIKKEGKEGLKKRAKKKKKKKEEEEEEREEKETEGYEEDEREGKGEKEIAETSN